MRSKSPQLPFTSINPSLLLRQVQKEKFPSIKTVVDVFFVNMDSLACIVQFGKKLNLIELIGQNGKFSKSALDRKQTFTLTSLIKLDL